MNLKKAVMGALEVIVPSSLVYVIGSRIEDGNFPDLGGIVEHMAGHPYSLVAAIGTAVVVIGGNVVVAYKASSIVPFGLFGRKEYLITNNNKSNLEGLIEEVDEDRFIPEGAKPYIKYAIKETAKKMNSGTCDYKDHKVVVGRNIKPYVRVEEEDNGIYKYEDLKIPYRKKFNWKKWKWEGEKETPMGIEIQVIDDDGRVVKRYNPFAYKVNKKLEKKMEKAKEVIGNLFLEIKSY